MPSRPDWGHGPNPPVPVFTEAEIRTVLDHVGGHAPVAHWCNDGEAELFCSCSTYVGLSGYVEWDADHFIEKLKEARE